jgi:hypothetical protein
MNSITSAKGSTANGNSAATEASPSMSRSTSTSRFKPYDKSSPMSKSRSEQFSPTTSSFAPHRKGSISIPDGANGSPLKSPLGMSRSHSLSTFATTPSTTTTSRSTRKSSISSIVLPKPRRDLTTDVFDQHSPGKPPLQQYRSRMTPPATPDLSSYSAHRESEFPFHSPATSTATSPAATIFDQGHQPSLSQVFDSSAAPWIARSESYQALGALQGLTVSEGVARSIIYPAHQTPSTSTSNHPQRNTSPDSSSSTSDLDKYSDSSEDQPYFNATLPKSPQSSINVHPHHRLPNLEGLDHSHHMGLEGGQWGEMELTMSEPTFAYPNSPQSRSLYQAQHQPSPRQDHQQMHLLDYGYRAPYLERSNSDGSEMQDDDSTPQHALKLSMKSAGSLAPSHFPSHPASLSSSSLIESATTGHSSTSLRTSRPTQNSGGGALKLMEAAMSRASAKSTPSSSSSSISYGGQSSQGHSMGSNGSGNGTSLHVDQSGRATLPTTLFPGYSIY